MHNGNPHVVSTSKLIKNTDLVEILLFQFERSSEGMQAFCVNVGPIFQVRETANVGFVLQNVHQTLPEKKARSYIWNMVLCINFFGRKYWVIDIVLIKTGFANIAF